MLTVIYRWRLRAGMEEQFVEGWRRVTAAIHQSCGSYGARLHRCHDGTWLAYARWPDQQARDACEHGEQEGQRLMREAVLDEDDDVLADVVLDLLDEPRP